VVATEIGRLDLNQRNQKSETIYDEEEIEDMK